MLGATGVTVFFTLSGFLITSLLLEEHSRRGRVSLRRFYERRARRLLPALVVLLAVAAIYYGVSGTSPAWVLAPLFYVSNWATVIGHPVPYLGHTWSLSVEEHFYLVWPLVMIAARHHVRALTLICAAGIVISNFERVALWGHGSGYLRVYYGSDAHVDALLIGSLAAVMVHDIGIPKVGPRVTGLAVALIVAIGSTPVIVGLVLLPVLTAIPWLTAVAIVGACNGSRLLSGAAIRWLGRRSYAIYLWHVPLLLLAVEVRSGVVSAAMAVVVSLGIAELSWRYVEEPFMRRRTQVGSVSVADTSVTV